MSFVRYVVTIVVDPKIRNTVMLVKKKGPAFLLGKLTFPGGRLELGESPEAAASREMEEETGICVGEQNWLKVSFRQDEKQELHVLAARHQDLHLCMQREEEPVAEVNLDQAVKAAIANPDAYSPDFLSLVHGALQTLELAPIL
jgi:8-oxo-dGTP pyrophosphatase MutT (NUDIX family)